MSIQWFPGHMNKARNAIETRMKSIDLVIEVTDARLPASSISPLLAALSGQKPRLKLLNKADLADPTRTTAWLAYFRSWQHTAALAIDAQKVTDARLIMQTCRELLPHRRGMDKPLRVLICGVPNVGKSTLINHLIGRRIAKVGNEAGITKNEQRLLLADDFWLYDTPGMLWPKIIVPEAGYHLAIAGSVGKNAYNEEDAVLYLIDYLKQNYPNALYKRYGIDPTFDANSAAELWLEAIARRRGALLSGGVIHYQKAAEIILTDFRSAALGQITLETPQQWQQWSDAAERAEAERQEQQKERQRRRKGRHDDIL